MPITDIQAGTPTIGAPVIGNPGAPPDELIILPTPGLSDSQTGGQTDIIQEQPAVVTAPAEPTPPLPAGGQSSVNPAVVGATTQEVAALNRPPLSIKNILLVIGGLVLAYIAYKKFY